MKSNNRTPIESKPLLNSSQNPGQSDKFGTPKIPNKLPMNSCKFNFGNTGYRNLYYSIFYNLSMNEIFLLNRVSKTIRAIDRDYINNITLPMLPEYLEKELRNCKRKLNQPPLFLLSNRKRPRYPSLNTLWEDINTLCGKNKMEILPYFGYTPVSRLGKIKSLPDNINDILWDFPIDLHTINLHADTDENTRKLYLIIRISIDMFYLENEIIKNTIKKIFNMLLSLLGENGTKTLHNQILKIIQDSEKPMRKYKQFKNWNLVRIWVSKENQFVSHTVKNDSEAEKFYLENNFDQKQIEIDQKAMGLYWNNLGTDPLPRSVFSDLSSHPSGLKYYYPCREKYSEFENLLKIFNGILKLIEEHSPQLKEEASCACKCVTM